MNGIPSDKLHQWSVHAEFTISHPGAGDPRNPPRTGTVQDEKGVRMEYSWSANKNPVNNTPWMSNVNSSPTHWSATVSPSYTRTISSPRSSQEPERVYSFQKGNLFFTSVPPKRNPFDNNCNRFGRTTPSRLGLSVGNNNRLYVNDSGYGSEFFSPNTLGGNKLPEDPSYSRKCRSTCSIVLSNEPKTSQQRSQCGRTQSLRCQTPSACSDVKSEPFYGCGDPWCHHLQYGDDYSIARRISPVKEVCEDTNTLPNCTCAVCDPEYSAKLYDQANNTVKRDVSVQTLEMVNKCTSPLLKMDDLDRERRTTRKNNAKSKLKRGNTISNSQKYSRQDLMQKFQKKADDSFSSSQQSMPKLSRSPTFRDIPSIPKDSKGSSSDSTKKPRTIHIDVYCTGTDIEADSDSSSDSGETKSASTPQTVFESEKVCVTHKKADQDSVPFTLRQKLLQIESKSENTSMEKESDDETSTGYPSKVSSYSTMGHSLSSMSSFQTSATPYSMSSCTFPDADNDSVANTSWKDTFSDIDNLIHSRSSVAHNDSLYFIPQKIDEETESITDSSKQRTETPASVSVHTSDSFEYANSEDKLRIKRMERLWKSKSPGAKRKLFAQPKPQLEVDKKFNQIDISKDSDSEHSDEEAQGWTFVKNHDDHKPEEEKSQEDTQPEVTSSTDTLQTVQSKHSKIGNPNDEGDSRSASKSPSSLILLQRLKFDPTLRSPFTISPGHYTEQRFIAKRFGQVVNVFKKPGHHIGPAKNPHCFCDHCKRHFEGLSYRNRTSSMTDSPDVTEKGKLIRRSSSEDKNCFEKRHTTDF